MRILHNIRFRTYSHATEDLHRVEFALRNVSGVHELEYENLKGHHGNPIVKITASMDKRSEIDGFQDRLRDSGSFPEILATLDDRVDEEGVLHIRLSKQAAYEGRMEMAADDDAVSVGAKVRAYPASRSEAIRVLRENLEAE